jgi:hypothetical protein
MGGLSAVRYCLLPTSCVHFKLIVENLGNAYNGPDGAKLRESVAKQHEEAANKAAAMVLQAFRLETAPVNLWVGRSHRFELGRGENGQRPEYIHHLGTREKVVETYFY